MLHMTKLDVENVWKLVKKVRKAFLSQHNNPAEIMIADDILLKSQYIFDNIDILEKELKLVNTSNSPNENVSYKTLQNAGEIFTYLNFCPPKEQLLITFILKKETPKEMILGLINFKNHPKISVRESTRKILLKVMEAFKLDTYEKIQIVTKGKCFIDNTFVNCTKRNSLTEDDIRLLGLFLQISSPNSKSKVETSKNQNKFYSYPTV